MAAGSGVRPSPDEYRAPLAAVVGPIAPWAIAAILGALAGEGLALAGPGPLIGGGAAMAAVVAGVATVSLSIILRRSGAGRAVPSAMVAATLGVALVAAGGSAARLATLAGGPLADLASTGGRASIEATVTAEPRPIARGWQVIVRVDQLDGVATRQRAALTLDEDPPALGERWELVASARPLPDGGYGRWLSRQHAAVVLDPVSMTVIASPGRLATGSEYVRERVRQAATRHNEPATGGLLVGFVIGDRRLLPDADQEAMRATGLTHLTAVSGSNVAIVIGGVLGLVSLLGLHARLRWAAVGLMLPWFAFITRFEPSVSRASTMAGILLLATIAGRARDARHALAAAVLVLVLVDPRLAGSLGLLLSATATAGVLIVAPLVRRRLPDRLPRRLAELTSISIGAQIAVLPLLLATFGEVGLASVPANVVAVPFAAIAATLGFVGTAVAVVHVPSAAWLFAAAGPPAGVVRWTAHALADVGGVVHLDHPAAVIAVIAAAVWVLARRRGRAARFAAGLVLVAVAVALLPRLVVMVPSTDVHLTAIDVGQGDAFLLESPQARILVDAGGDGQAARWLVRNGRRHLDLVVVTHPHLDHVGGVPDVLRGLTVDTVWAAPLETSLPEAAEVVREAARLGIPVRAPVAGEVAEVGDLLIEVLHPPPGRPYRFARSELNESSYVLRVHHPEGRILFTGDVEHEAQRDLLAAPERLDAEVMTVPHHGAGTTDPAFLAAVAPHTALISVGADNSYGHPVPAILDVLAELGTEVHRTDVDGTVRVRLSRSPTAAADDAPGLASPGPELASPRPLAWPHDPSAPHRRRRRPAAAARTRPAACHHAGGRPGAAGRSLRRERARTSAGAADGVAVRRPYLHRRARDRVGRG